jgi:hypothetical protein
MWTLLIATFFINYNIIPDVPYLIKVDIFEQEYTIIRACMRTFFILLDKGEFLAS